MNNKSIHGRVRIRLCVKTRNQFAAMLLTHSFQGRFLIVAALLGMALMFMAVYTKSLVRNDTLESTRLISQYKRAEDTIKQINELYLSLKSSLYQYTLLLTPELKAETTDNIEQLLSLNRQFNSDSITKIYPNLKKFLGELDVVLNLLKQDVDQILVMQDSAASRYPAVKILLGELQPMNRYFIEQLNIANDEVADLDGAFAVRAQKILDDVKYAWARRVSEVRLFVANRSGTFGHPEEVLPKNIATEKIYAEHAEALLEEIREKSYSQRRAIQLKTAIDEMLLSSRRYGLAFRRVVSAFMDKSWRADVYFLETKIEPLLKHNLKVLQEIQNELSVQMEKMLQDSVETSSVVTDYVWWFVTAVYILLMMAYAAFEKTIRRPLFEVANALEAQGNDESYVIPERNYYVTESEVLIDAFTNMKEQVDSRQLRLQSILQNASDGMVIVDRRGVIETFNPAAEKIFRVSKEDILGRPVNRLLSHGSKVSPEVWHALWIGKLGHDSEGREYEICQPDGGECTISIKISSMTHVGETYYIAIVSDVTERKAMVDRLQNLADMDSLTGLHNRRYFTEELDRLVERSIRNNEYMCALLFIDLDNFKYVNDTFGHHAGDRVLIEVSNLLQSKVRKSDMLARLGGDEFAIILYNVDQSQAEEIAGKYQSEVADFTYYEQGQVLDVGCTIGVAMLDGNTKGRDDLLMRADFACQMAKQLGRGRVYVYSDEDEGNKDRRQGQMGMAQLIRNAIRQNQFSLYLQPIMDINRTEILCHEALLRLQGEDGKLQMPNGFLPSAQRFNLMKDIDLWVIDNAVKLLSSQREAGMDITLSVNLSAQSIGASDVFEKISDCLREYNVPPAKLIFEITESVAIAHIQDAGQFLQSLRELGCKTALDDFGVGYASYAYLKDLPADYVKIDGTFISSLEQDEFKLALVKSMNEIAHVMGKKTIAEYVENEAILKTLKEIGIDYVQGSLTGEAAAKPRQLNDSRGNVIPIK